MTKSTDPTREIALMALKSPRSRRPDRTLRDIIDYAFDQLCWRMGEEQLREITAALNAKLDMENA